MEEPEPAEGEDEASEVEMAEEDQAAGGAEEEQQPTASEETEGASRIT